MRDLRTVSDFVRINEVVVTEDLVRLDAMLKSDLFLKALGQFASEIPTHDFPVISDIVEANRMMVSQEIWDTPEPWPYQYFPEIQEDELGRLWEPTYNLPAAKQDAYKLTFIDENGMGKWLENIIQNSYRRNNVFGTMIKADRKNDVPDKSLGFIIEDNFPGIIFSNVYSFIEVAFLGGLENSPIFNRMMEAYEVGGMPCGWLGPMPEDGGDDPVKAIALLHFGKAER